AARTRRRSAHAMPAGSSERAVAPFSRRSRPRASGPRTRREPPPAYVRDPPFGIQVRSQRECSLRGQSVWAAAIVALQRFDQALALESRERLVHRAGRDADVGESLDVLCQRVAVLWAVGEA